MENRVTPTATYVRTEIQKAIDLLNVMLSAPELLATVERVADRCSQSISRGGKVMFCGNGGSAADSQHLAAELVGKLVFPRTAMAGLALTTDTSALTAIGNDFGFEHVFARQVEGLGKAGDVLIGLSTSGKSKNVVLAFEAARAKSISTVAMTGEARGPMAEIADEWLAVPHRETQKIQEGHIVLGHIFCALVENRIHGQSQPSS
jgi:D-sedoheptulose 7-phosphate isomerase